jgi:hypothetical protein
MTLWSSILCQVNSRDEGVKEVIGRTRTAFPDIHWVPDEMVDEWLTSRMLIDNLSQLQQLDALPAAQTAG